MCLEQIVPGRELTQSVLAIVIISLFLSFFFLF